MEDQVVSSRGQWRRSLGNDPRVFFLVRVRDTSVSWVITNSDLEKKVVYK